MRALSLRPGRGVRKEDRTGTNQLRPIGRAFSDVGYAVTLRARPGLRFTVAPCGAATILIVSALADAAAFVCAHLRIGERKVVECTLVPLKQRRDQPPEPTGEGRDGLKRHRRDRRRDDPEPRKFDPIARRRPTTLQTGEPLRT